MADMDYVVQFKKLRPDAIIPTKGTSNAAGWDLYAVEDTFITGGMGVVAVPTGIAVQVPEGTYGRIAMRSGMALNGHFAVSAGVIDRDYTGEIKVLVYCMRNCGPVPIGKGQRFAQLILEKVSYAPCVEVEEFARKFNSHDGFGSTGS